MRTREKIILLLVGATLILGAVIFFSFQSNETEANYMRWLMADKLNRTMSSPGGVVADELPSGTLFYGGLSLFAIVMTIVVLKMVRDGEIQALRQRLREVRSEKHEAESALQEQVWKGKSERQAKDSVMRDLESSIEKIEGLLSELNQKEVELKTRDAELSALKLREAEEAAAEYVPGADRRLREELKRRNEILQAKDAALRDVEQRFSAKSRLFENQLREKDGLLKDRENALESFRSEVAELNGRVDQLEGARKRAEERLDQELRQKKEVLDAEAQARLAEEKRLGEKIGALEAQVGERDKLLRQRESEASGLRLKLTELEAGRAQASSEIEEISARADKDRQEKEQALRATEQRLGVRVHELQGEIGKRDLLLQTRDDEIRSLSSEVKALSGRLSEMAAAKARVEAGLQKDLDHEQQQRESGQVEYRVLEERHRAEVSLLRTQLGEREEFLKRRDADVQALEQRAHQAELRLEESRAENERTAKALREQAEEQQRLRQASEASAQGVEQRYGKEVEALKKQLHQNEDARKSRDEENKALKTQVASLAQQLSKLGSAKEQAAQLLQQSLKKEKAALQAGDSAVRELEEGFKAKITELEQQIAEKESLAGNRADEISSLETELQSVNRKISDLAAAKEQAAQLFQQSLEKEKAALRASDSRAHELEERFKAKVAELEKQVAEKQQLAGGRAHEVSSLQTEIQSLNQRLSDIAAAKERAETLFEDAVRQQKEFTQSKEAGIKHLEEDLNGKIWNLETRLKEKEELLHRRDAEIGGFKNQLTELTALKERATLALEEDLKEKSDLLRTKEAALEALEERFAGAVRDLESDAREKQERLSAREAEVRTLLEKLNSQSEQIVDIESTKDSAARALESELRRATELAQSKETAMKGLEERLATRVQFIEAQLNEKQDLLAARDSEVDALMAKVGELTRKLGEIGAERERADRLFQEELREKTALLESNESSIGELEERFAGRIESLQRQVAEKQKLLEGSGAELGDLRAELHELAERLDEAEAAKIQLEGLLEQERSKSDAKALMVIPTHDEANGDGRGVDTLMSEREELLKTRDKLIQNLMTELKEKKTQLARQEIEVWKGIERRAAWKHRLAKVGIRLKD